MKKILLTLVCAVCVFISLSVPAFAGVCDQTLNTGAATTIQVFWEQSPAFYGWSGGTITNDMYFNGCGQTAALKINYDDWSKLLAEGKLDGLRYIKKDSNGLAMRKVQGTEIVNIPHDSFFDSTTVVLKGNK
jgi:hypothetical protein